MDMKKYTLGQTFDLQGYMKDLNKEYEKRKNNAKKHKEDKWK